MWRAGSTAGGDCTAREGTYIDTLLSAQVEWNNAKDPTKGFKYLYLSDADYTSVAARADAAVLKAEPFFAENGGWTAFTYIE